MSYSLSESELEFIERMGLNAEADGMARITGRIWGLLIITSEDFTAASIADMLKISRGSVSTNVRALEMLDIIEKKSRAGERELYYTIGDQPYASLVNGLIKRLKANRKMVQEAIESGNYEKTGNHLTDLHQFYSVLENGYKEMIPKLEDQN